MELKKSFGSLLSTLRKSKFLTQEEVANKANLSTRYIISLEQGKHQPTLERFYKICWALNEDPTKIIHHLNEKLTHDDIDNP